MRPAETTEEIDRRRRAPMRVGIAALNLIAPGLGLLRLGRGRAAMAFLLAPFALLALVAFGMGHLPIVDHGHAVVALVALLVTLAALVVLPAILTWRASRFRTRTPLWSRWYAVLATALVAIALSQGAASLMHGYYRPFQVPSESMMPTLRIGDRFVADMRWRGPFRRGQIALFDGPGGVRIGRIAGLPGDRIALRDGVPIVNGHLAVQLPQGPTASIDREDMDRMTLLTERLPDEPAPHRVIDAGMTAFDEMPEVVVPAGHLFLLGDHRDRSADSRVPIDQGGTGMVPTSTIIGRPMYIYWSDDHERTGTRLARSSWAPDLVWAGRPGKSPIITDTRIPTRGPVRSAGSAPMPGCSSRCRNHWRNGTMPVEGLRRVAAWALSEVHRRGWNS